MPKTIRQSTASESQGTGPLRHDLEGLCNLKIGVFATNKISKNKTLSNFKKSI